MESARSIRFADDAQALPPPHLPFDLPLIPINLRVFDPDQSHPLRDHIRYDGVPYSHRSNTDYDGDVEEPSHPTPIVSARRRSVVSDLQDLKRRNSLKREKNHQKLKERFMPNPKIQLVPALDLKPSQASHFPMEAIQQSQKRLKKAAARSKKINAPGSPLRYDIPVSEIRSYASSKLDMDSQYSQRTSSNVPSQCSSSRESPHSVPIRLPSIRQIENSNSRKASSSVATKQSGLSDKMGHIQVKGKDRKADWDKHFEDEVNPETLLLKLDRKKDQVLSRLTRKKMADEITSPLVSEWRSEFAKRKDGLSKKLNTQLEERNEERVLGNHSSRVLSKAYEGALEDAESIYRDGVPKRSLIWHRARKALIEESPDSERIAKFHKELQHYREENRVNTPETQTIRNIHSTIKVYLEDACVLDHQLLTYLVKNYGSLAQTQRPVYDLLNFVRVRVHVPWKVFINSLMSVPNNSEESMSIVKSIQNTPTRS